MTRFLRRFVGLAIGSALVLGVTSAAVANVSQHAASAISIPSFSTSQLLAPAGTHWIAQEGNLYGQRYSTLKIITPTTISGLSEAWHVKLAEPVKQIAPGLPGEAPQLEYNGTVFAEDQYGGIYALNATTGQQIWEYNPHPPVYHIPASDSPNIGGAVFKQTGCDLSRRAGWRSTPARSTRRRRAATSSP